MSGIKYEDIRFSSSSIDDFLTGKTEKVAQASRSMVLKTASVGKVRISGVGELSGFQLIADDKLVRLSQKDFWKLGQDADGPYIERLVEDSEGPIKG